MDRTEIIKRLLSDYLTYGPDLALKIKKDSLHEAEKLEEQGYLIIVRLPWKNSYYLYLTANKRTIMELILKYV